ncbi:serine/arginine repetitive matrix protein 2 [Drosophila erecta]|uniref:serine/arginine repetitive matrix protein 2 n=1 Tax=Drosophila erecta TaxID=7220 RepID=UPI000F05DD9C|nr:serine/arginine repetitive matrix protein 2 [Drosophila erecta]
MSMDMSRFLGGGRRTPANRNMALRTRTGTGATAKGGAGAAQPPSQRNPRPPNEAAAPATGASKLGGGTGASQPPPKSAAGAVPKRPASRATPASAVSADAGKAASKRATGGGGLVGAPTGVMQTSATSTLRRRPAASRIPISRRVNEVKWIMKPSQSFTPCSKSSSENNLAEQASGSREPKRNHAAALGRNSSSSGQLALPSPAEQVGRTRSKVRSSRIFRVPSQRIMHVDELMHAQLRQMDPRRARTQPSSRLRSRSPNWSASRLPSPLSQQSSFRSPASSSSSTEIVEVKEVPLRDSGTVSQIPAPVTTSQPSLANGLISCSPSPAASPVPSQSRLQSPTMSTSWHSSSCTMENGVRSSTSSSSLRSNATSSNTSVIECRSGIRTPTTEQLSPAIACALGGKAIKLTSTVIRIMQPVSSKGDVKPPEIPKEQEQLKLPVQKGRAKTKLAMNAAMVQSISPPKFTPMVKVPNPISQSVNHVVNQLTAQLKEAAMMHLSEDDLPKDSNTYEAFSSKDPSRKPSIYLLMNQPKSASGASGKEPFKDSWVIQPMEQQQSSTINQQTNRYLDESLSHPRQHLNQQKARAASQQRSESRSPTGHHTISPPKESLNQYAIPPKARRQPKRSPSKGSLLLKSRESQTRVTRNPYMEEPKTLSRVPAGARRTPPVSVNRISQACTSTGSPKVVPPPGAQKPQATTVGKIIRKEQHKVPRTMEDGIDMSYQYFVSIPLKRGKKPQVVRYLYRPMVRQLNAPTSPNRRSRRASRKAAAAAAAAAARDEDQPKAAEEDPQQMDPELKALGGMPLPLDDSPQGQVKESPPRPAVESRILLDPEAVLNAPYEVPPLKLHARYKSMMEQLAQMPYPEEKSTRPSRRRGNRQVRAAGGADQVPSSAPMPDPGIGGGDGAKREMDSLQQVSSIWKSGSRLPKPVNYRPEAKRLSTATGAPVSYHAPVQFGHPTADTDDFILPGEPMIQAITYDDIEEREQKLPAEQQDSKDPPVLERKEGTKSVSFHPGEVEVSEFSVSSSSISISSTSSSSSGVTKTKARRTSKKRKSKSKGRNKLRK